MLLIFWLPIVGNQLSIVENSIFDFSPAATLPTVYRQIATSCAHQRKTT